MRFSIFIPHYGTGKMTAFTIAQLLKYRGDHDMDIMLMNNKPEDDSKAYLEPFMNDINYFERPIGFIQSHGTAYDLLMELSPNEHIITIESDSFPTEDNWLEYYAIMVNQKWDFGGSMMKLSGGTYMHPAGALYKRSQWVKAWEYCRDIEYQYFPNMSMKENFACHTMIHHSILNEVLQNPNDWVELSPEYSKMNRVQMLEKAKWYSPIRGPFHNGMGKTQESVRTYGLRDVKSEVPNISLTGAQKIIKRIGYEPGQWFSYWLLSQGKRCYQIPTETKWIENKVGEQQEYTLMENGFKHLWGVSAYKDVSPNDPIAKIKQSLPEQLYETLPEHQKIKP